MTIEDLLEQLKDDYYNGSPADWKAACGQDVYGALNWELHFDFDDEEALAIELAKDVRGLCDFRGLLTVEFMSPGPILQAPFSGKIFRSLGAECSWEDHRIGEFVEISRAKGEILGEVTGLQKETEELS